MKKILFISYLLIILISFQNIKSKINFKISIITSLYNGKKFIKHFLEEITKQTIFNDCQLIIIDANSKENEELIIRPYLKKYKNIIYKKLKKRISLYAAWNQALKIAKGEYIINANVDDRVSYNCYEKFSQTLDANQDIDLVYADGYQTNIINKPFNIKFRTGVILKPEFSKLKLKYNCLPSFYPMWRKNLHMKFGFFNEKFKIAGDWEFWIRAVKNGAQFKKINGIYAMAYHNPLGLSTNSNTVNALYLEKSIVRNIHKDFFINN